MLKTLANAWKTPDLKKKMIFTMIIILLYRLGSNIPVPYVNALAVEQSLSQYVQETRLRVEHLIHDHTA